MSIESGMPSNHLILCCPLLLLPSTFPSIRVFSNESALCSRWPKYSASVLPVNIQDWFPLGWTGWISWRYQITSRPGAWAAGVLSDADVQQVELRGKSFPIVVTHVRPASSLIGMNDCEGLLSDLSATSSSASNPPSSPLPELSSLDANITYNPSTSGPHLEDQGQVHRQACQDSPSTHILTKQPLVGLSLQSSQDPLLKILDLPSHLWVWRRAPLIPSSVIG